MIVLICLRAATHPWKQKLGVSFWLGFLALVLSYPKCSEIANANICGKSRVVVGCLDFLLDFMLQDNYTIFVLFGCGQLCLNMPKEIWNNKAPISQERVKWLLFLDGIRSALKLPIDDAWSCQVYSGTFCIINC